jgi:hypothetical protein
MLNLSLISFYIFVNSGVYAARIRWCVGMRFICVFSCLICNGISGRLN